MEILINPFYFGIEYNKTSVRDDILSISSELNNFVANKVYSQLVDYMLITLYSCFPLAKAMKRPRYIEDGKGRVVTTGDTFPIHHELYVDIVISDALVAAKGSEVSTIVGREIIAYFEQVKLPLKIRKSFDKERFISDLRTFFNIPNSINKDAFTAEIEPVASKSELFDELNKKLQFPSYFGFNWDALHELLRDFSWIPQKNITIVHKGLSLPPKDYEVYMSIVNDSVRFWQNYPDEHVLSFDFT